MASLSVAEPEITGLTSAPSSRMRNTLGFCRSISVCAHIDHARQAKARGHGGGGDAMLAGAGLGDDAGLAHAPGEQDLAQAIVDLVRAGVVELVALEVDFRAAEVLGQPLGVIERARPADIVRIEVLKLGVEGRIVLRRFVGRLELKDQRHQRFGDEASAIKAEMTPLIGTGAIAVQVQQRFGCTGHELYFPVRPRLGLERPVRRISQS